MLWNLVRVLSDRLRRTNVSLQSRGEQMRDLMKQIDDIEIAVDDPILEDPDGLILVEEESHGGSQMQIERTKGGSIDILLDIKKG